MAGAAVPQPEDWDKYKVQPTIQKDDWSQYAVSKKASGSGGATTSLPSSNGSNNFQSFLQPTDNNLTPVTDPALKQQIQDKQTQAQQAISDQLKKVTDTYDIHLSPDEKQAFSSLDKNYVNKDALRANTPEEVAQEKAMDTPLGKLAKQATYVGSQFSKSGLDIVKGGAWVLNHAFNSSGLDQQTIPDATFNGADKATDFGLTAGQKNQIENDRTMGMGATRTLGMLANFIPTAVGGEVTGAPKAMFALQGIGQGKTIMDKVDPDHKINGGVRDLFIAGNGIANAALMGDAAETTFAKLPAQLRGDITSHIAMEALKQDGEKALTADGYKSLVEKGAKDWADNFYKLGTDYVAKTARVGLDLSALNASQYALQKGVDLMSDKPVFNANLGGLAENVSNTVLNQAPILGAIGSATDISKLTPYSDFRNNVIDALTQDPTKANEVKQNITEHGQQMGWTPEQIDVTNNHIDQIADAAKRLPNTIKPEKKSNAVQLVLGRDELKQQLANEVSKRSSMDESVSDIPTQHEQYLTDKIDQANDKIRDLATGKKTTYSKGTAEDEGAFFKTTDGNKQEITESRYNLENLERNEKVSNNAEENANGQETNAEKGNNEENGNQKVLGKPIEEQIIDDLKNKRFATFKYDKEGDIPDVFKGKQPTVNELTDKSGNVTKQFVITIPKSEADYLLQQKGETQNATQNGNIEQSSVSEHRGTAEQQQGVEQNRNDQEKPIEETKAETSGSNSPEQGGKVEQRQVSESHEGEEVKKTILTKRAYEGTIQEEVKKHLEDKGLTRKSFTQEERSKQATDFINKFGEDASHMAVENGDVDGGMAASILAQLQVRNSRAMSELPEGSDERDALAKKQADLIATMEKKGYLGGEFNGQLAHEYQNAELDFANVKKQVEDLTGKPITEAQEKKVKDLTDQNQQLKQQLADTEAKLVESSDREFKQDVVKKETHAEKSKRIANKLRSLKITTVNDATLGIPVALYNGAIETSASLIEGGGKIADAIDKGLEHIRDSDWYKSLSDTKKQKTEQDFKNKINDASGSNDLIDLQERFVNKSDSKFSPDEARSIWGYLRKTYIDNGTSYKDAIYKTADDLGLSWKQVSDAVTTPKIKRASDEMWKKQADLARNRAGIKNWIGDQNKSVVGKAIQKVSGLFRGVAVTGHAGIFIGTHAGMTLFNPSTWHLVIPAYLKAWKFAYGNTGEYERSMEELKNNPNYLIAQRAGLKNNPDRINAEEYQKSQKYLGKLGLAGERGFNAIKVLRQSLFDNAYNRLTPAERDDPEVAKSLAHIYNLATGATDLKLPGIVNEVTFAGGMEASRWQKLTQNPVKATEVALNAIFNPSKASTADRIFAKVWSRRVGEQLATYTTALLANAALQNSLNPNNPVNLTNPDKPDFLKFKFGDRTIDPTSGMRSTAMFIYKLGKIPFQDKKELHGDNGIAVAGKDILKYGRGKLSPLYGTVADFYAKQDFNGNVMPFSSEKLSGYAHKLTWGEYAWEKAPLPVAEAAQDIYKSAQEHGADKKTLNNVLNGIVNGAISGTTGVRVGQYDASSPENNKKNYAPNFDQIHLPDKSYKLNNDQLQERQKYYDSFMQSEGAKQMQLTIAKTTNAEEKKKLETKLKGMASKVSKLKILQKYHNAQTGGYDLEKIDE